MQKYQYLIFLSFVIFIECKPQKYTIELTNINDYTNVTYLKNKERIYVTILADSLMFKNKTYKKKGINSKGDVLLIHEDKGSKRVFSHLSSQGPIDIFNIEESLKGNTYVNGDIRGDLTIDNVKPLVIDSISRNQKYFVAKYDRNKTLLWVKLIQGNYQTNAFFNKLHIDDDENIYFSYAKRKGNYIIYDNVKLDTSNIESKILFQIDKNGKLKWSKYSPKLTSKALDENNTLLTTRRDTYKKHHSVEGTRLSKKITTEVQNSIISISKDGEEVNKMSIDKGQFIKEIFPLTNNELILLDSRPKTKNEPTKLHKISAELLEIQFDDIAYQLLRVSNDGTVSPTKGILYNYIGYGNRGSYIDYKFPTTTWRNNFLLLGEHIGNHENDKAILEILKLNLKDGNCSSNLYKLENVIVKRCFFEKGKLYVVGYSRHSFLLINGNKLNINNSKFDRSQIMSLDRLNILSSIMLIIDI